MLTTSTLLGLTLGEMLFRDCEANRLVGLVGSYAHKKFKSEPKSYELFCEFLSNEIYADLPLKRLGPLCWAIRSAIIELRDQAKNCPHVDRSPLNIKDQAKKLNDYVHADLICEWSLSLEVIDQAFGAACKAADSLPDFILWFLYFIQDSSFKCQEDRCIRGLFGHFCEKLEDIKQQLSW